MHILKIKYKNTNKFQSQRVFEQRSFSAVCLRMQIKVYTIDTDPNNELQKSELNLYATTMKKVIFVVSSWFTM